MPHHIGQAGDSQHIHIGQQRGFGGIGRRDKYTLKSLRPRQGRHRQNTLRMARGPVQRQLANKQRAGQLVRPHLLRSSQDSHSDGQIIRRAFFTQIGRGQINGDTLVGWKCETAVFDGGVNTVAAFAHSGIRQAYQVKGRRAANNIYFYVYNICFQADNGTTHDFRQHNGPPSWSNRLSLTIRSLR